MKFGDGEAEWKERGGRKKQDYLCDYLLQTGGWDGVGCGLGRR